MSQRQALGRGLSALISNQEVPRPKQTESVEAVVSTNNHIDIESIVTNPFQPRTHFDQEALLELSESIKVLGVIQPITVKKNNDGKYTLISGERRLRASKLAGLKTIPAFVRDAEDDAALLAMALVENIQREDLDAVEVALSYKRLMDECNITQESLSDRVGKKRSTIANFLRLLNLPPEIQKAIRNRQISMGHAKALLFLQSIEDQMDACIKIIEEDLSVRQTEEMVKNFGLDSSSNQINRQSRASSSEDYKDLFSSLSKQLGTNIELKLNTKGKGRMVIPIESQSHLEQVILMFDKLTSKVE